MTRQQETGSDVAAQLQELRDMIAQQHAQQEQLRDVIAQQQAELQALQARLETERAAEPAETPPGVPARRPAKTSRRRLLTTAGAAVVLAGEASRGTAHAAPTHADTATFQQSASGGGNAAIEGDSTSGALGVVGTSDSGAGVYALSSTSYGVF